MAGLSTVFRCQSQDRSVRARDRIILLAQLITTAAILGWLPGNEIKLMAMILVWVIGFAGISGRELVILMCVNALFSLLDLAALRSGAFQFLHPDLLGLPIYEFFMWGFLTLHLLRFVARVPVGAPLWLSILLAVLFALPFATMAEPMPLFYLSSLLLITALAVLRHPADLIYTGYMIAVGCLIEYIGVWTGQWTYPNAPFGGVALWFIPMWGGIGLFTGRLLGPLVVSQMPADPYSRPGP